MEVEAGLPISHGQPRFLKVRAASPWAQYGSLGTQSFRILRSAYDFAAKDFKRKELWPSAKLEFQIFSGLIPMLVADLRLPWSQVVTVTDASQQGYGICEKEFSEKVVSQVGRWQERWRYKGTSVEEWAPRRRALGDPLVDPVTAARNPEAYEQSDCYCRNEKFEKVPVSMLQAEGTRAHHSEGSCPDFSSAEVRTYKQELW